LKFWFGKIKSFDEYFDNVGITVCRVIPNQNFLYFYLNRSLSINIIYLYLFKSRNLIKSQIIILSISPGISNAKDVKESQLEL
jgi:hypothetical protein